MDSFKTLSENYPKFVVFKKEGLFYTVQNESAIIMNNLHGFRLYLSNGEIRTGCPAEAKEKVAATLDANHINYIFVNKDEVEAKQEYEDNTFEVHTEISDTAKEQVEEFRKKQEEKKEQIALLKAQKAQLQELMDGNDPFDQIELEDVESKDVLLHQFYQGLMESLDHFISFLEKRSVSVPKSNKKNEKEDPIVLPTETFDSITQPIELKISEFAARINEVSVKAAGTKISAVRMTNWLLKQGMLQEIAADDQSKRRMPTEAGIKLGIRAEKRNGLHGEYIINLYSESAQRYLLDHLSEM